MSLSLTGAATRPAGPTVGGHSRTGFGSAAELAHGGMRRLVWTAAGRIARRMALSVICIIDGLSVAKACPLAANWRSRAGSPRWSRSSSCLPWKTGV